MKRVLGLDLGTTSIGWALVEENENDYSKNKIIKLGVRVNPLTIEESGDFEKGKSITTNADRTLKRSARRNLHRYKLRRKNLIEILLANNIITKDDVLTENGKNSTFETLKLRAKAAKEKVQLNEFARILLNINKKRGYKSSRKVKEEDGGTAIDGMSVAKEIYDKNLTPGQYAYNLLKNNKKYIPDFYRSDLKNEFKLIWKQQKKYYPNILTDDLFEQLSDKNKSQTWAICKTPFDINGIKIKGKKDEIKLEKYKLRTLALKEKIDLEYLAIVLQEINNDINKSSGYLGEISDRSKLLYFNNYTVGEYLYKQVKENPHNKLKNQVFYRQDYLDEFETIWETQSKYHNELTNELKEKIRDVVIFYQRKLKSQKHLISECEFEKKHKVAPKSSPLFQEFKIWQTINNIVVKNKNTLEEFTLNDEHKFLIFEELNIKKELKNNDILKLIQYSKKDWEINYDVIQGNLTNSAFYDVYKEIAESEGYGYNWDKKTAIEKKEELESIFKEIKINPEILNFDYTITGNDFDKQPAYQLWHLIYSATGDEKITKEDRLKYGNTNVALQKKLIEKFGFKLDHVKMLVNVSLQQDYGSLSTKAIKKILPYLTKGNRFDEACEKAGYNHSSSLTKDELLKRDLKERLDLFKKNSLRNPVVEKILNQMVNLVNQIIDTYGKPDEIRIELSRELKKSAKERKETTEYINKATKNHKAIKTTLQKDFGIKNPTKNDIIKYKLYKELVHNGYKTIYTNQKIDESKLFTKEIDIEHIIPKSRVFNDSFSNKTLAYRDINLKKGNATAFDFIKTNYPNDLENYKKRISDLVNKNELSKAKAKNLLMTQEEIPDGFIERDLRNTQYIVKKAKQKLEEVFRSVNTTTGMVTAKLRANWGILNVLQELNLSKFKAIDKNLIEEVEKKDGTFKTRIKNWSKRNDHRHHAMDALTVAFTKPSHVQYLNFLNARKNENHKMHKAIIGIEKKETYIDKKGKRKFKEPLPNFRAETKKHLENILVSFKAKNKVVTKNKNKIKLKGKNNYHIQEPLTPRGQLHKESICAKHLEEIVKTEKINAKFDLEKINQITKPKYKQALLQRLKENNNNPKIAFTGKNALSKNPVYLNPEKTKKVPEKVKIKYYKTIYTIRKDINSKLNIDKVVDGKIKTILENRIKYYSREKKQTFSDLENNPIWLNKEKDICIKKVRVKLLNSAVALHSKKDHLDKSILTNNGKTQATDFVNPGNNHHIAIYKDQNGNLQEKVVSFFEAVSRAIQKLPIIDKNYNKEKGWKFLFTLKQNEMFVFSSKNFNPKDYNLLDPKNASIISKHLYRVQKVSSKDYVFRHHLETKLIDKKELNGSIYIRIQSLEKLKDISKVRLNHIGEIVAVSYNG